MKTIKLNRCYIELYDSIDSLPITQFQQYQKYLMLDSGIGSDVSDVVTKITTLRKLNAIGQSDKVEKDLINLQQNIQFCITNSSPKMYSFCCLIKTINGKQITDYSQDNLDLILKKLSQKGMTFGKLKSILNEVKKNLTRKLIYFSKSIQTTPL